MHPGPGAGRLDGVGGWALRRILPVLALFGVAIWLRLWLPSQLDLRDLPGAAGVLAITRAVAGELHRGWDVWFIGRAAEHTGGDVVSGARLVGAGSSVAAVLGASLAGWALGGRFAGLAAGLFATFWSLTLLPSVLVGADPPVIGLAWLGVGLCWAGFRARLWGLPAIAAGVGLVILAASIKELALPAMAFLALGPLMVRGRGWPLFAQLPVALWVGQTVWTELDPRRVHGAASMPALDFATIPAGIRRVLDLPLNGHSEGVLHQVLGLALLGALVPGPRPGRRLIVAAAGAAAIGFTAEALGDRCRPRFLISASPALIAVAGCGLAGVGWWLCALARWLPGALSSVPVRLGLLSAPALVVAALLALDSHAFFYAWGEARADFTGADQPSLPTPIDAWARRYSHINPTALRDLTAAGSVDLVEIVDDNLGGGVAIPRLRDDRHHHLEAAAALAGTQAVILDAGRCCSQGVVGSCAGQVVAALDGAGITLALPTDVKGIRRVNKTEDRWLKDLRAAASAAGGVETSGTWWQVRAASGSGGELPCQRPAHTTPGKRRKASGPPDALLGGEGGERGGRGGSENGASQGGSPQGPAGGGAGRGGAGGAARGPASQQGGAAR